MGNDPKTAEKANERMGYKHVGDAQTDDQVQQAVDDVATNVDGLAALPSTDVGNALAALKDGRADKLELFYVVARDMFVKGDLHGTEDDYLEAAEVLGKPLIAAAKLVAALIGKL
jgi:hypothetical protein